MFVVALCLSAVAAFYSIVGLTAIFAAAVMPIVLMGSILEVAKLTVTVWLHEHWDRARWLMKIYLSTAVVVLMVITSMGIFGFLSKAHSDQSMVSGDVQAKIAVYDEKIKTSRENIDANRKALKQMDEAVDQVMARSTSETGADKAVALRRTQQKERQRLLAEIEAEQKRVSVLAEERAPIAAEVRKVEAEVGPIKYIAALIYGDNTDTNMLEAAVRWVIILLVIVFDPLAVMMLLAATESRKWLRQDQTKPKYEQDDGPLTQEQVEQIKESTKEDLPIGELVIKDELFPSDPSPPGWMYNTTTTTYPSTEEEVEELKTEFDRSKHAYLDQQFQPFENLQPMAHRPESENESDTVTDDEHDLEDNDAVKQAKSQWKIDNPGETLKEQRRLFERGIIDRLPWEDYLPNPAVGNVPFGEKFPTAPARGDMFTHVGYVPSKLYKFNGEKWIEIIKDTTDQYTYNQSYIDYLINAVSSGHYDADLLTEGEQAQIESRLQQDN